MKHNKNKKQRSSVHVKTSSTRPWTIAHLALIVLLGCIIYSNTLWAPFVFDDGMYIVNNMAVSDPRYFTDEPLADAAIASKRLDPEFRTRMVGFFTFALNYRMHGLSVFGYHLFNIIVHIGSGLLVYWLVLLTFRTPFFGSTREMTGHIPLDFAALLAALLFTSHPIQTQAVTYISQRFTSLAAFFCLLSLIMYVRTRLAVQDNGSPWPSSVLQLRFLMLYAVSVAAAVLAMKTKEIAFTFPLVIVLYEIFFFTGEKKDRMLGLLPLLLTMLIIPLSLRVGERIDLANLAKALGENGDENLALNYLFTQFRVLVTYLRLLFLPVNQNLDYDYPVYKSLFRPEVYLSLLFLLILVATAVYLYSRSRQARDQNRVWLRLIAFGIFWFFIMLSVESTVLPLADVIFEHRLYLPSVGIFLALIGAWGIAGRRMTPKKRKAILALLACVVGLWSVLTFARNNVWGSGAVWEDAVRKSPGKSRPHYNLGMSYADQGRSNEAINQYKAALRINPDYAPSHNNLGILYRKQGRIDEAIKEYIAALRIKPHFIDAHINLGVAYESQGRLDEALEEYYAVLKIAPDSSIAHCNLGMVYERKGRLDQAINEYLAALKINANYAEAHNNLGAAYERQGDLDNAIKEYMTALKINPNLADTHNNVGAIYAKRGKLEEAAGEFEKALRLNPNHPRVRSNLDILKERMMKRVKADQK